MGVDAAVDEYAALPEYWIAEYGENPLAFPGYADPDIVDGAPRFVQYDVFGPDGFGGEGYVEKEITYVSSGSDGRERIRYTTSDRSRRLIGAVVMEQIKEAYAVPDDAVTALLDEE